MAIGNARNGFDLDLLHGEARESAFVAAVCDAHVECKADGKCRGTGRVAIEIRQGSSLRGQGRLSGLSVTTAKWWAIEYADDCWLVVRTSLLKALVRQRMNSDGTVMGGDGDRFELVLLPVEWFVRPFKVSGPRAARA